MYIVGKIDIEKYKCITEDIITDEVIITEKQVEHIKENHPNDFERFNYFFKDIVEKPDYIVEANKPNTALILKEIVTDQKSLRLFSDLLHLLITLYTKILSLPL